VERAATRLPAAWCRGKIAAGRPAAADLVGISFQAGRATGEATGDGGCGERSTGLDVAGRPRNAHPARRYDYWLGGRDNFAADRESGDAIAAAFPAIRTAVVENRSFLRRTVRFLAAERGVRQFLDLGTGIPTSPNVHEIVQAVAPESRVVYVDNDPIVLAHRRALLTSSPEGATAYIDADLRTPETILDDPGLRATIDLSRPVALVLVAVVHFVPDEDDPHGLVARLVGRHRARQLRGAVARHPGAAHAGSRDADPVRPARAGQAARPGRDRPVLRRARDRRAGIVSVAEWRAAASRSPGRPSTRSPSGARSPASGENRPGMGNPDGMTDEQAVGDEYADADEYATMGTTGTLARRRVAHRRGGQGQRLGAGRADAVRARRRGGRPGDAVRHKVDSHGKLHLPRNAAGRR